MDHNIKLIFWSKKGYTRKLVPGHHMFIDLRGLNRYVIVCRDDYRDNNNNNIILRECYLVFRGYFDLLLLII